MRKILHILSAVALLLIINNELSAQQLRTSYFMDKSIVRTNLNPALLPARGYFNIPVVSSFNMNFSSNALTVGDVFQKQNGSVVTFLYPNIDAKQFLSKVKPNNKLNIDFATSLFGLGFYSGRNFWSFNVGMSLNAGTSLPKELFEFAKLGSGVDGRAYNLKNIRLNTNAYMDMSLGYSRIVNDRLTVGGKIKYILGVLDVDMEINDMLVRMNDNEWSVNAKGTINGTMKGIKPKFDNGDSYFSNFDFGNKYGVAGYGFGIDLGAAYKLLPNLTLSAAIVDLGFISWSAENNVTGTSAANYKFEGFNISNGSDQSDALTSDFGKLTRFKQVKSISRRTNLNTTINMGGEYAFLDNKLSAGLLFSNKFRLMGSYSELTLSGNWRPLDWLSTTVSYSFIHSDFRTLGCALNISPSWINFFVGTDYVLGEITTQFVPISQKCANFYFGVGIPLKTQPSNI